MLVGKFAAGEMLVGVMEEEGSSARRLRWELLWGGAIDNVQGRGGESRRWRPEGGRQGVLRLLEA